MDIDLAEAGKPPQKLRKLLKHLSPEPDPETVHELRTQTRKLEAVLHALSPRNTSEARHLLRLMKPVRRAAGRVRDMDVLIAKATSLSSPAQSEGVIRLIEHMSAIRTADARRLHRKVKRRRKQARAWLSHLLRNLHRLRSPNHPGLPVSADSPQILVQKLDHWPPLNQQNLHEFRKRVKELHYLLQLFPAHDGPRMTSYANVKDTVGDWHDWMELSCLAESLLAPKQDAPLLREIRRTLQEKLRAALVAANSLRKTGIEMPHAA